MRRVQVQLEKKAVNPPAKLNIRLKVLGRRPDRYHELNTIMAPVGLYDSLELKIVPSGISIHCNGFSVPGSKRNLAARAAAEFLSAAEIRMGVEIRLAKNIPVAAGLGGGSSDAASTLMALNEMFGLPLLTEDLSAIALKLGADVPFFLKRGVCVAGGIGEILEPIENWPALWYVIVVPPISVSTAWVYGKLKSREIGELTNVDKGLRLTEEAHRHIISILAERLTEIRNVLENDLEAVTASHFPVIEDIKNALLAEGAEGALMSGSGPSVFGVFTSEEDASRVSKASVLRNLGDVFVAKGIS